MNSRTFILDITLHVWKSHRFLLGYCLNKQYGIRSSHCMSGWGAQWSQYSAQTFPWNLEDNRMEHYAIFSNARDSVTFYSIVRFAGLCCDIFLNAQIFKSPQKLNSIWENNAAPFTSFQHWGTFSHCSDISPSLTRFGLVRSNHWRNTENTFYCSAWKSKIKF